MRSKKKNRNNKFKKKVLFYVKTFRKLDLL